MSRFERFRAGLSHAFAVDPGGEISEADRELVDRVARVVVSRRMTVPALLALETGRPLTFLGSQVAAFFGPLLTMVFSRQDHDRFVRLMERRGSVDVLIDTITEQENQRRG